MWFVRSSSSFQDRDSVTDDGFSTAIKANAKDVAVVHDVKTFDNLPDFPSLANSRRQHQRAVSAEEMVWSEREGETNL